MGHSRGGEGMRAAYNMYLEPESPWPARIGERVRFQGIFEIGPTDAFQLGIFDALNTRWAVLLPMCDGDVAQMDGIQPFDRMILSREETRKSFKATYSVWGANHNFYNSEWQIADRLPPPVCSGPGNVPIFDPSHVGSPQQRETGRIAMLAFFRGSVGDEPDADARELFNPLYPLPRSLTRITRIERGYTPALARRRSMVLEDFLKEAPLSTFGIPNDAVNVSVTHELIPEHDESHQGGVFAWNASQTPSPIYWQTNFTAVGTGLSLKGLNTLDLRVDRADHPSNPPERATDFTVRLVNADNSLSEAVPISEFVSILGPVGGVIDVNFHSPLQTARIPLTRFTGARLQAIRGVRLTFDRSPTGVIYVANIRAAGSEDDDEALSALTARPAPAPAAPPVTGVVSAQPAKGAARVITGNVMTGPQPGALPGQVELEFTSPVAFPTRGALLLLHIGSTEVRLSRYVDYVSLNSVNFTLSAEQFAQVHKGDPVTVDFGRGSDMVWDFGVMP